MRRENTGGRVMLEERGSREGTWLVDNGRERDDKFMVGKVRGSNAVGGGD
jgi:hypothetical protein